VIGRIALYRTAVRPCGYLPERQAANAFVDPDLPLTPEIYAQLLERGFRRSGRHVYRPACPACRRCVAVRVPVEDFVPARRQRRTLRRNEGFTAVAREPRFTEEHFALYRRYTASRHGDSDMADASPDSYMDFLTADWAETRFLELRQDGELLAVAVTDRQPDSLSAVYTFFAPDQPQLSLGVQAILQQIAWARQLGKRWLYLGYWINDCRKMNYKADYRPLEVLTMGHWQRVEPGENLIIPEAGT
jgi:arginine-tRNA-protein transferase